MTVIAWDGITLAVDRRCMIGGVIFESVKLAQVHGPRTSALLAAAGDGARFPQLVAWYKSGADPATYPPRPVDNDSVLVVIERTELGRVRILRYEGIGWPLEVQGPYYADGIGRDAALAAMYAGKTAVEAVFIASQVLNACGGGCDAASFGAEA